jgi:squalene-hopene/tetraprenyl-beta-curcumene cyclase
VKDLSLPDSLTRIQQETVTVAAGINLLQERWPDGISLKIADERDIISDYFPYLFISAFPSVTTSQSRPLAIAGQLLANSLVLYDGMMDDAPIAAPKGALLQAQAMQFEAYHLLQKLFPSEAVFWEHFRQYLVEYANACLQEQRFVSGERPWREYTETLAIQIAIGRSGVARTAIAGLVELDQNDQLLSLLEESINHFFLANQMLDDLVDWKEDLRRGIPSLLLSRVVNEWPVKLSRKDLESQLESLARKVYYRRHAHYVLEIALESLDRADHLKSELPDLLWWDVIAELRCRCEMLLKDIKQIVEKNLFATRS